MMKITIDGSNYEVEVGDRLIDVINRVGKELPQVCYNRQLGPIQTCDTCLVEVNGDLVRACATAVADGMRIETKSARADAAQREAFDRILANHILQELQDRGVLDLAKGALRSGGKCYKFWSTWQTRRR
jgi:formate dehydrogenase major subunit